MFHQGNLPSCKYHLSAVRTLVVFLLVIHCGGQAEMIGSSTPLLALIGEDILLPCRLVPGSDIRAMTLEWARLDLNPRFVHLRRGGVELLVNQNPSYKGRTSLSTDKLQRGDMSLMLSKVKLSDEGEYRCQISGRDTLVVKLVVGSVSSPVIIIKEITAGKSVLECESKGWYPEPEVLWLDHKGKALSAGPTETLRGPDGLYTVSSRVTVETTESNIFTCRVHQRNITQTRETRVQIQDDVFVTPSNYIASIVVVSLVALLLFSAVVFLFLWKLKQKKGNNMVHCKRKNPKGRREEEQLVEESQNIKSLDDELQEKEEEKNDMLHVISMLKEQKTELERSREEHKSNMVKEEKKLKEKMKKIQDAVKLFWDTDAKNRDISELEKKMENKKTGYEKSLKSTENEIKRTEDMISEMNNMKDRVEKQIDAIKKALNEWKLLQDEDQERLQSEQSENP